ncbi:MucR family transcriptional regulator [Methylobacterium hispanicum]|uniref:MucR family transcriptional regulator n=1 Tax=Methylobacterium TaxID=407 RepID=UPI000AEA8A53|nr:MULTISPECIES: MucR family transcriptional regulator [Methylobacterium]
MTFDHRVSRAAELPKLIRDVHSALNGLGQSPASTKSNPYKTASTQVRKSIQPNGLISFIHVKPYQTLKRHLKKHHLSFQEYRERLRALTSKNGSGLD